MSEVIYRAGVPDDAGNLSELILSFRDSYMAEPDGTSAERFLASVSVEAERGYLLSSRYDYLVAEMEGKLAGFLATRDQTHVFRLFVAPQYQNRGIARELWRRTLAGARERGTSLHFTVNSSLPALSVYERFGFVKTRGPVTAGGIVFVPMQYLPQSNS